MRYVSLPDHGRPVSALGFGCASLGSRIAPDVGRAALERALEAGITWFDVAPSYGGGHAEHLLGAALAAAGRDVAIVTKVGLVPRPVGPAGRVAGALLRPLLAAAPSLRGAVKRLRPQAATRLPLNGDIVRSSLLGSLERLRVDRVAMLALHEPALADVRDESVIAALVDMKRQGLVTHIGIAGSLDVYRAARAAGLPATVVQTANSPFEPVTAALTRLAPYEVPDAVVTHSVFGVGGALDALKVALRRPEIAREIGRLGYAATAEGRARLLIDYAFAANPRGVVLTSAYAPHHLAMNAAAAARAPQLHVVPTVDAILAKHDGLRRQVEEGRAQVSAEAR
jgi:aryl-alcohol dehydrogenase-like predicted oxidoreductase